MTKNQTPRSKPVGPPNVYANGPKIGQPVIRPTAPQAEQQAPSHEGGQQALTDEQIEAVFADKIGMQGYDITEATPDTFRACKWFKRGYRAALAAQPHARAALTDAQLEHEWRHFNAPVDNPISLFDFECVAIAVQEALGIHAPQTKEPTNDR